MNSTIGRQYFPLSSDLLQPLLDAELLPEAVTDAVTGDLVAIAVDVLDVAVVCPLVTHVKSGRYWAAVGVSGKKPRIRFLIRIRAGPTF